MSELRSPASAPAPIEWPADVQAAACLTFDLDAEAAILTANANSVDRMSVMSHQSYGPLVGVPRILSVLANHGAHATFFTPGFTAHRYPEVVRLIADAGHEIAHHSYFHENVIGMSEQTEAEMIDLGLAALWDVAGVRPTGYRAPMWEMNWHTPKLLADRGFVYDSSLMDSDHPYVLAVPDSAAQPSLVEVPVWWGLDDWEQYAFLPDLIGSGVIESPAKALEMWTLELEAMHKLGAVFNLCAHPFMSGRPARAEVLDRLLGRMRELSGTWITTVGAVANHVASLDLTPRIVSRPVFNPAAHWVSPPG